MKREKTTAHARSAVRDVMELYRAVGQHAGDPEPPPFSFSPAQREALLKIISPIMATPSDTDWDLLEIGCTFNSPKVTRLDLQVSYQMPFRPNAGLFKRDPQTVGQLARISKAARQLRQELLNLPHETASAVYVSLLFPLGARAFPRSDVDRLAVEFHKHLIELSGRERTPLRLPPSNVDYVRNHAWKRAAEFYERVTGRSMGTAERRDREGRRLEPDNECIRFIKAYTEACGAEVPTGDSVRHWIRGYLKGRHPRRRGRPACGKYGERMREGDQGPAISTVSEGESRGRR
jgi:hypothetical protein